jgi:hypothetical protein
MSKKSKRRARAAEAALAVDPPIERAPMWGSQFVDSIRLSDEQLNTVFVGWFLTALLVFGLGNIFLSDAAVLAASGKVTLVCLGFIAVAYSLSRVCGHPLIGVLLTMVAAWGFTYARQGWLVPVAWVVGAAAAGYCVWHIRVKPRTLVLMLLAAAITAVMSMGCPKNFTTFDMIPRLNAGYVHMDTLYHASMAAMIKNYGVTSTGLQGLVEIPYHAFSHASFAAISVLSGVSVIEVYGVAPWVLFAPMLIFACGACVASIDRSGVVQIPLAWTTAATLTVALPAVLEVWRWESFLPSESQTLGMAVFVLSVPVLFKQRLTTADLLGLMLATSVLSLCKGPVAMMMCGLWGVRLLICPGSSRYRVLPVVLGVASIVFWSNARLTASTVDTDAASIQPLHFITSYSWRGGEVARVISAIRSGAQVSASDWMSAAWTIFLFVLMHFILTWVAVLCGIVVGGFRTLWTWPSLVFAVFATAACLGFIAVVRMPYMALFWFTSVTFFISIPAIAAWVSLMAKQRGRIEGAYVMASLLLVIAVNRGGLGEWIGTSGVGEARPGALQWARQQAPRSQASNELIDALRQCSREQPITVVLERQPDSVLKNHLTQCMAAPFLYPAVSERPWIEVISLDAGCQYRLWGYERYIVKSGNTSRLIDPVLPESFSVVDWSGQ